MPVPLICESIRVRGLVQGVGFRPTVWRLARDCGLLGDVRNDGAGVLIRLLGQAAVIDDFVARLIRECPPLARIDALHDLGIFNATEREDLKNGFVQITNLLLAQQIADFRIGRKITYFVHPDSLSKRVKSNLADAMKAIDRVRDRVRAELMSNLA